MHLSPKKTLNSAILNFLVSLTNSKEIQILIFEGAGPIQKLGFSPSNDIRLNSISKALKTSTCNDFFW